MKPKALWIEDSARLELANLCGPVFFNGHCRLALAEDVTTAVDLLLSNSYEALIVDVRLPPGSDARWRTHYRNAGAEKVGAQLGLKLLSWLLGADEGVYPAPPPDWITPDRIGVFTVESRHELLPVLEPLGIHNYQQKVADLPDTILNDMINGLISQNAP
jgi:hypothetical protein